MKKKTNKQIREIAERLPVVYEQHMSGFTVENGDPVGNFYVVEINHERRLRHAYEKLGMQGIHNYLETIHKLQIQRNEKASRDADAVLSEQDSIPQTGDTIGDDKK